MTLAPPTSRSTSVTTSEYRTLPSSSGSAPDAACSELMTICAGVRPCRTSSPQPVETSARPRHEADAKRVNECDDTGALLQPHDFGSNEDEQLAALIREFAALEQPAE